MKKPGYGTKHINARQDYNDKVKTKMVEERELSMTYAELQKASARILKAMNDAQFVDGHTVDEVLMAALFVVGAGLKRRGAVLQMDVPLRIALPPLVNGYKAEAKRMGQQ